MMNLIHIIDCYYWIWIQSAINSERCLWLWGSNAHVNYGKIYSARDGARTGCVARRGNPLYQLPSIFLWNIRLKNVSIVELVKIIFENITIVVARLPPFFLSDSNLILKTALYSCVSSRHNVGCLVTPWAHDIYSSRCCREGKINISQHVVY